MTCQRICKSTKFGEVLEGKAAKRVACGNDYSDWFRTMLRRNAAERHFMSSSGFPIPLGQSKCPFKALSWAQAMYCACYGEILRAALIQQLLSFLYWTRRVSSRNVTFCCASVVARGE